VSHPGQGGVGQGVGGREIAFMCADTGTVMALRFAAPLSGAGPRATLIRATVFLPSGGTLLMDGASGGGTVSSLVVREHGSGRQYDLRLSASAARLTGPTDLVSGGPPTARRVPVSVQLALEPASQRLALETAAGPGTPAGASYLTLLRGAGSLAAGSVIHSVQGTAWLTAETTEADGSIEVDGAGGAVKSDGAVGLGEAGVAGGVAEADGAGAGPGGQAGCRARAVFQDGSALYVAREVGPATAAGLAAAGAGTVAALVHNTNLRATAIRDFTAPEPGRGRIGGTVSWAAADRSPAGATAEIRDPQQQLTVRPDPADPDGRSWSCAPFVFVRSGVTGLGLVERWDQRAIATTTADEAADELPDPY
jgi:hypothetical protein